MTPADQLEVLAERIAALEFDLAVLRASLAEHVRTRRIVVVDEAGVERIVLDARHRTGSVLVRLAGVEGATTGVEVYASEPDVGRGEVGMCVLRDGDVVSRWSAG